MKTKATVELGNLPDPEFFEQVAEGMDHCIRNAMSFLRDARLLGRSGRKRSAGVLVAFGHEEIAKYLILLDAVRCPRQNQKARSDQLRRFNSHLAKGLYIALHGAPATLAEVRQRADSLRADYYLDGPNDVDWIFRNEVTTNREQSIYVDYVVSDEGARWHRPDVRLSLIHGGVEYRLKAHRVALCLHAAGFSNPKALAIVAEVWRNEVFEDSSHWSALRALNLNTLQKLEEAGRLRKVTDSVITPILDDWLFPLYGVDLSERKVSLEELRDRQANWSPDW